jgi:hypothetical protein
MKLNVGCGTDYREGFVNIDGSDELNRVDKVIDVSTEYLPDHFEKSSIEHILANDIIEHHFHWEGVQILAQFHELLVSGGTLEVRVPDTEYIIKSWRIPLERKIVLLYGGQDIAQGVDPEMDRSRAEYPQFFCHKYGWTQASMRSALEELKFTSIRTRRAGTNFIATAAK